MTISLSQAALAAPFFAKFVYYCFDNFHSSCYNLIVLFVLLVREGNRMTKMAKIPDFITTKEAAELLNVTSRTITRWVMSGYFPGTVKKSPVRNSGLLIPRRSVEKFIEERKLSQ